MRNAIDELERGSEGVAASNIPSIAELIDKPYLTVPETIRIAPFGRSTLFNILKKGRPFRVKKINVTGRKRPTLLIHTRSFIDWLDSLPE